MIVWTHAGWGVLYVLCFFGVFLKKKIFFLVCVCVFALFQRNLPCFTGKGTLETELLLLLLL